MSNLLANASPTLWILVRPPADRLKAMLSRADWVRSAREERPGELVVDVDDPKAAEAHMAGLIANSGARLIEYGRAGASLQDVFFELTKTGPYSQGRQKAGARP